MFQFREKYFQKKFLYVIGVSGGPDSIFLLNEFRKRNYKMIIAHINYGKRADSYKDEKIVRDYCVTHSLMLEVKNVEDEEFSNLKNFQDRAREIRYDFFKKIADKYKTNKIVIAHNFEDNLETFLLQKRKKSLVNHWGLKKKTQLGNYWLLRPILDVKRKEVEKCLKEENIDCAFDYTNSLPLYKRNIIRKEIFSLSENEKMKILEEINNNNQRLLETLKLVNENLSEFSSSSFSLKKILEKNLCKEVILRLLFFWVNKLTDGILIKRRKKLLLEIYKQLFESKKRNISINIKKEFNIIKEKEEVKIKKNIK